MAFKILRQFHLLKQNELAEKMGLSKAFVSELESGKKKPSIDVLDRYAEQFKMAKSEIIFLAEQLALPIDQRATQFKPHPKIVKMQDWLQTISY